MLLGVPGTPVSNARYQSAATTLKKAGIKVVLSSLTDACVEPTAIKNFRTLLLANPKMNAAYTICGPDGMAVAKVLSGQPRPGQSSSAPASTSKTSRPGTSRTGNATRLSPSSR